MRLTSLFTVRNLIITLKIAKRIMHYTVVVITIEKGHVFSDQFERTVPDRLLLQSVLCLSCMPDKFLNVDYFSI